MKKQNPFVQFDLIQPCNGISIQLDGERGKWLYRGYFVGDEYGSYTGRWRDTLSPAEVLGYEGCFFMGRRRLWPPNRSEKSKSQGGQEE
jgi:hypothetical protein